MIRWNRPAGELREVLRRLDLEGREDLVHGEHDDPALVEHPVHEDVRDPDPRPQFLALPLRRVETLLVPLELPDLPREGVRLPLDRVERPAGLLELLSPDFEPRLGRFVVLRPALRLGDLLVLLRKLPHEVLPLRLEVPDDRGGLRRALQSRDDLLEPLPLPGDLLEPSGDGFESRRVRFGPWGRIERSEGLDLLLVEGREGPVALVRLPPELVLELLELPPELREHEDVRVDGGDLPADPFEGLRGPRLLPFELPHEVLPPREPRELAVDPREALLEPPLVPEELERRLPVQVRPQGGDFPVERVDLVLDPVPPALVVPFRLLEQLRPGLGRLLAPTPVLRAGPEGVRLLPQPVEGPDLGLEGLPLNLQVRGGTARLPGLPDPPVESVEALPEFVPAGGRPEPRLVACLQGLDHRLRVLDLRLERDDPLPPEAKRLAGLVELGPQPREAPEGLQPRGDVRLPRPELRLELRELLLRPLEGPLEDLEAEELLEDGQAVRPARGPEVLHLFLPHERGVPEADVVEADDVPDRLLLLVDRPGDRVPVPEDFEVRLLPGREAPADLPAMVPLAEPYPDVPARSADVRRPDALDVRPRRRAVQGERDRVEDRRLARARAARDDRELLREPEGRIRPLDVAHEALHLDLVEDEPLAVPRGLGVPEGVRLEAVRRLHASASRRIRWASARIASRLGSSARVLST